MNSHLPQSTLAIMAAGSSSRYGTLKQIAPVGPAGETLLDFTIFDALQAGFENVLLIVRREILPLIEERVSNHVDRFVDTKFVVQDSPSPGLETPFRAKPWGTAHAVLAAGLMTDDDVAVVNADDYYGRDTFRSLRRAIQKGGAPISIVTHRLDRTLSANGSVSRGVCHVDPLGNLVDINEIHHIRERGSSIVGESSESEVLLTGAEPVVMNTWYFTRDALTLMRAEWDSFIGRGHDLPSGAEFGLAPVVKVLLSRNAVQVGVEATSDECFGLTNPGDEERVTQRLLDLTERGLYPSPLWSHG